MDKNKTQEKAAAKVNNKSSTGLVSSEKQPKIKKKGKLRTWYELTQPSKKFASVQFLTSAFHTTSKIIEPIFAAKVITSLYSAIDGAGTYGAVYLWILLVFANHALRQIAWHINYINYPNLQKSIAINIQSRIFDKIMSAKERGLKQISMEKLRNIINNDINVVSILADSFITKFFWLVRVLVFLILTIIVSPMAALMGIGIMIINYCLMAFISRRIAKTVSRGLAIKDEITEQLSEVVRAKNLAKDYGLTQSLRNDYIECNRRYYNNGYKYHFWLSCRDNWVYAIYQGLLACSSIFLVYLVSKDTISIENYLVVTGYLLSCITTASDAMGILAEINNANVSVLRVNTLLNLEDKEFVQLGKHAGSDIYSDIVFNNVSFNGVLDDEISGPLKNVNIIFPKNTLNLVYGPHRCGKRSLFYLLRRKIAQDSGVVTVNGIAANEYDEKSYKNIVNFASFDPYFFKGSLMKNFLAVNPDKVQINKICEILGIKGFIESLPNGFNTSMTEEINIISPYQKFMFGLAAALLTGSRCILIYGVPLMMTKEEKEELSAVLTKFKKVRTIIMILPDSQFANIADNVYNIVNGIVVSNAKSAGNNKEQ